MSETHFFDSMKFHGFELLIVKVNGEPYVAMKEFCTSIGLSWGSQYSRIKRHHVLKKKMRLLNVETDYGPRKTTLLPMPAFRLWASNLSNNRISSLSARKNAERLGEIGYQIFAEVDSRLEAAL